MPTSALAGVNVLDLTHYIAGPYCTRILAGFGADVIKIERPGEGDGARRVGPFLDDEPGPERSGLFLYLNGSKHGITLNLKSERGVEIFREMVADADVVVESFSPGVMRRLGLDYASLKKINPNLVLTSISNFGQTGPYRDYKISHAGAWGLSGARYTNGRIGERPVQLARWMTHYVTGLYGAIGTATALFHRAVTGRGQHVDVSMMDSAIMMTCHPYSIYSFTGLVHTSHSGRSGREVLECQDGGYVGAYAWDAAAVGADVCAARSAGDIRRPGVQRLVRRRKREGAQGKPRDYQDEDRRTGKVPRENGAFPDRDGVDGTDSAWWRPPRRFWTRRSTRRGVSSTRSSIQSSGRRPCQARRLRCPSRRGVRPHLRRFWDSTTRRFSASSAMT